MTKRSAHGAGRLGTEPADVQECPACQARQINPYSGRVHFQCLPCCANLVAKVGDWKEYRELALDTIATSRDAPLREDILEEARKLWSARRKRR